MAEKTPVDNSDASRDEVNEKNEYGDTERRASLAESMGRRRSVAVNVVENPLKVSFAVLVTWRPRIAADRSIARQSRGSCGCSKRVCTVS